MARIIHHDESAMAELYDRSSVLVYSLCRRIVGDREGAETAALDTYMQVWQSAASFNQERGSVEAWLLTLARSRSLDERRRLASARRPAISEGDSPAGEIAADMTPYSGAARKETETEVRHALDRVSAEEREVLDFAYFEGLTHRQIADRMHTPVGTVKSRIRSGVGKLRRILHPLERGLGS